MRDIPAPHILSEKWLPPSNLSMLPIFPLPTSPSQSPLTLFHTRLASPPPPATLSPSSHLQIPPLPSPSSHVPPDFCSLRRGRGLPPHLGFVYPPPSSPTLRTSALSRPTRGRSRSSPDSCIHSDTHNRPGMQAAAKRMPGRPLPPIPILDCFASPGRRAATCLRLMPVPFGFSIWVHHPPTQWGCRAAPIFFPINVPFCQDNLLLDCGCLPLRLIPVPFSFPSPLKRNPAGVCFWAF